MKKLKMILTYKYKLLPTKRQHAMLLYILEQQRQLYNAALEERIGYYGKTGKTRTLFDQIKALTEWRQSDIEARSLPVNLQRWTLRRLDVAFTGFFQRLKSKNGKAGYPRFKGFGGWNSFGFGELRGLRFDGKRLRFKGMYGGLRVHLHRALPAKLDIKVCVFKYDSKSWWISFDVVTRPRLRLSDRAVGVDVGIKNLAVLSTGELIPNVGLTKRTKRKLRIRQRALSRCKQKSKRGKKIRRQVTKHHLEVRNTRRTYLHQVSTKLIKNYDLIAVEKLDINSLVKSKLACSRSKLAKYVYDASWGILNQMLRYKAEKAGALYIQVDPKNTSQDCSWCGTKVPKTLAVRTHNCPNCGLTLDRDVNAAKNILHKAVLGLEVYNVGQWPKRSLRNLNLY